MTPVSTSAPGPGSYVTGATRPLRGRAGTFCAHRRHGKERGPSPKQSHHESGLELRGEREAERLDLLGRGKRRTAGARRGRCGRGSSSTTENAAGRGPAETKGARRPGPALHSLHGMKLPGAVKLCLGPLPNYSGPSQGREGLELSAL